MRIVRPIAGVIVTLEDRIFFTVSLFFISEIILGVYIIVSILVYIHRPGRYFARMPTSIAATIALFASSAAVKDLQGTAQMTNKERDGHLKDQRYRYGSYIGSDGSVHVGIEKMPFVQHMKEVEFEGTRVEKELRRRKAKGGMVVSTEDVGILLEELRSGRGDEAPVTKSAADTKTSGGKYTALQRHDDYDEERSVSPLENVPLSNDQAQRENIAHRSDWHAE